MTLECKETVYPDDAIRALLDAVCSDTIDDAQFDELEAAMLASEDARRLYLRYFSLESDLHYLASILRAGEAETREERGEKAEGGRRKAEEKAGRLVDSIFSVSPSPPLPFSPSISLSSLLPTTPLGNVAFSYAMSAVLVAIGLFIFSLMSASSPRDTVVKNNPTGSQNRTTPNAPSPTPEPEIVSIARITGMVDCVWVNSDDAPFHDRVVLGTKYMLKSGLLEITYYTGAKVILQGPCTYTAESTAGGFLSLGKLTARVEKKSGRRGEGEKGRPADLATQSPPLPLSPSPTLFSVHTPTAIVTDLGTEFGVEVDKSGVTASHVFQGKVKFVALDDEKSSQTPSKKREALLGENDSASTDKDRDGSTRIVVVRKSTQPPEPFVRGMPRRMPIQLYNTGVGLKEGDTDPHWQVIARSDDPKFHLRQAVVAATAASNGIWLANQPDCSQWISIANNKDVPNGVTYIFRTTFELHDAFPGTAVLRCRLIGDNYVSAIRLNGKVVATPERYEIDPLDLYKEAWIRNGFVAGINMLEIDVYNGSASERKSPVGAMGLRVELEGTVVRHETPQDVKSSAQSKSVF